MICLADNDLILKLAGLDLLIEGFDVIGANQRDVRVLQSAEKYIRNNRQRLSDQITVAGFDRACTFVRSATAITGMPSLHDLADLNAIDGIDRGETLLFECAYRHPDSVIATGDKKSLAALANAVSTCPTIYDSLSNRVICFEQVLSRLIKTLGYDLVRKRACAVLQSDGALRQVFVNGEGTLEFEAAEKLRTFLHAVSMSTGALLVAT